MSCPLLSIIIPVYNSGKYLNQCLNSIAKSSSEEIEVIIVDDGSTDETVELLNEAIKKDPRFRMIHQENGGVSKARNNGIRNAKGRNIMFLDADDMMKDGAVDFILNAIREEDEDFIAFAYETFHDDGVCKEEHYGFKSDSCRDTREADRIMYASSKWNECWGKVFRKRIIDEYNLGFLDGVPIGEAFLFVLRYYEKCRSFFVSNETVLLYRQHAGSAMKRYGIEDRLKYTEPLYDAAIGDVRANEDKVLLREADTYYFRVVTNLFREFAGSVSARKDYKIMLDHPLVQEILSHVKFGSIPTYKRLEYIMLKYRLISFAVVYFRLKAGAAV